MRILITGGKTATAFKLLKAFDGHQVFLADYGDMPSVSSSTYQLLTLGKLNKDTIAHELLNCCLDNEITFLLPLYQETIESLIKAQILFKEFDVNLLVPSVAHLEIYPPGKLKEKKSWVIFMNGEVLYANPPRPELVDLGNREQLNGAFYYGTGNNGLELSLIVV